VNNYHKDMFNIQSEYGSEDIESVIFFNIAELAKNRYTMDVNILDKVGKKMQILELDYPKQ
jgi:hypothetical protein